jgi:HD-GYP domain-containing protein (c-di-GMP phosphodiesterase class II)
VSSAPVKFLNSLAQTLATMTLYASEHPSWARAVDLSFNQLRVLQQSDPRPRFSFLGTDVIYGGVPIHELAEWPWARRLAIAGVQRLEFAETVTREDYAAFLQDVLARLSGPGENGTQHAPRASGSRSIQFGAVGVRGDDGSAPIAAVILQRTPDYPLGEEAEAMSWVQNEAESKDRVPLVEAEAVARSLAVAMRGDSSVVIPLLRLRAAEQYNAVHSINTSILAMALAGALGLGDRDVHAFGMAGLLFDLGMAKLPREVLASATPLNEQERALVQRHPVDGACLILASDRNMDMAATVAYEHHVRPDGTGYPGFRYPRSCHFASRLVRICDVYDALRTTRPHRHGWTMEESLRYIEGGAGPKFDAEIAAAFILMMRRLAARMAIAESDAPDLAASRG